VIHDSEQPAATAGLGLANGTIAILLDVLAVIEVALIPAVLFLE